MRKYLKQYIDFLNNNNVCMNKFIDDAFHRICSDVHVHNMYGFKKYTKDLKYTQYWRKEFTDKVVDLLKAHFTDSIITSLDHTINIDWSAPTENIFVEVNNEKDAHDDTDDNVEISITLPSSRIRTRSSSRKGK